MDLNVTEIDGACHCGTVRFHVRLKDGLRSARRCTCSYCRMRGAIAVSARIEDLQVTAGEESLRCYTFNSGIAQHHFCGTCGIYTHHRRRSNPQEYGVNVACLSGISPFDFAEVIVNDGVSHPSDTGVARIAGVLRFIPADGA
ncbi:MULTISPECIES: GFA family protein [Sphingobium]|uniref:GFA family protein n=1 Tax=Sphingobium TaxID=165695 RepID=UPI0015ECA240|nr:MULTISPECIES: GFA family protein [Sphingobium]MCW2363889.1 hypothetical protein [Sphingobium sp. B10D3B]MCW2402714.1 hypothetical protein [Sphingobium sp. B10D7B]MCW2409693.1 hypothetical protein [Sphingobium xanthum]